MSEGFEAALGRTEDDAGEAVAATKRLASAVRAAEKAAQTGDLRALARSIARAEDAVGDAAEAVDHLAGGWTLSDEDATQAISSGAFTEELMSAARQGDLAIYRQEEVLASYPSLVRLLPAQGAVSIDRKLHRQIRPSHLVEVLRERQEREPRLNERRFAETLHDAYRLVAPEPGVMAPLIDIHDALTLLPSARAEYSRQEFARDVYLLDRSGHTQGRRGARLTLSGGSTAARNPRNLLMVVTREGAEKSYYGIEFREAAR